MSTTLTETVASAATNDTKIEEQYRYSFDKLKPYTHPLETKADLPWSELVTLDLEDYDRPGGKERLVKQLEHAVHHVGFFYVKNFGIPQEHVDRQFTLAQNFFELPVSEKEKYEVNYGAADYNGWRRPGRRLMNRTKDNIEMFNMPKFTKDFEGKYGHPDLISKFDPKSPFCDLITVAGNIGGR